MYLRMNSDIYGTEDFGPYDTRQAALAGQRRIEAKAAQLADGIEREFEIITNAQHRAGEDNGWDVSGMNLPKGWQTPAPRS